MSDRYYDEIGNLVKKERKTGEQKRIEKLQRKNKHALRVKKEQYRIQDDYDTWMEYMR